MRIFNLFMYQLGVLDRYCDCLLVFLGGVFCLVSHILFPNTFCSPTHMFSKLLR